MNDDDFVDALKELYIENNNDTTDGENIYWNPNSSTAGNTYDFSLINSGAGSNYNAYHPPVFASTAAVIKNKYSVMNLPRKEMPIAVFVSGRMATLGLLGTDVECAYTSEQIVFSPGLINASYFNNRRITVSVEYTDEILHYNVGDENNNTYKSETSSTLNVTLVSTIKKEGAIVGVK